MSEIQEVKQEISELRQEVRQGFRDIRQWSDKVDVGMKGNEEHDVWGYKQKISYNKKRINANGDKIQSVEAKVNKIIWTAIGAGAVTGTAAAIIFNLVLSMGG